MIDNIVDNKEDNILIKKYEKMYYNDLNTLNNIFKDYKEENKPEYIKDMVEIYLTKIKPVAENIRNLKYKYTGINYNEDDDTYTLIEEPYTISQIEYGDSQENKIISFVR